jgi:hypothetical protein
MPVAGGFAETEPTNTDEPPNEPDERARSKGEIRQPRQLFPAQGVEPSGSSFWSA